jgi:translation initiation factor 5B
MLRQPIVSVLGHVDHGKTSLLDKIRGSAIAAKESGGITQSIGASIIPADVIKKICKDLLNKVKLSLTIPGLLIIDTPGHAAFINLRKRGGNLADIAILVIDINEGLMAQTIECIQILKQYKTPFVIAVNKIDLLEAWFSHKKPLLDSIADQTPQTSNQFETKLYEIVGKLFELGLQADRFDRVSDYTKQVALVPVSAKNGEGIPELLVVLTGLAQKFLEQTLKIDVKGPAKGIVLEVAEQKGLGKVIDAVIYDGSLKVGDQIVLGGIEQPIVTKVKAMFQPAPLAQMQDKTKFENVKLATAATGVRIVAPDIEQVTGGVPLFSAGENLEQIKEEVQREVEEVLIDTQEEGVFVKADTLGSLEALSHILRERKIPVRKTSVGPISKKDLADAKGMSEKNPLLGVILGFNIPKVEETEDTKILVNDVIYRLVEDYESWREGKKKNIEMSELDKLTKPCKIELLKGYVFRQSNPAILGVEVTLGTLRSNTQLMNKEGVVVTSVKGIQQEKEKVEKLEKGKQGAVSLSGVSVGRQIFEGEFLYSAISENEFRKYKEFKEYLSEYERMVMREISEIMRKKNPVWGI